MSEQARDAPFLRSAFFAPRLGLRGKSGAFSEIVPVLVESSSSRRTAR